MIKTHGYAAQSATTAPAPFDFEHRDPRPKDVVLDIQFCGICHSDIHQARGEWGNSMFPMVPGHEIVGVVTAVGGEVTKFKVGDTAAVGCMVDSCRECASCKAGEEQYCDKRATVFTYNSKDKDGNLTFGGYANHIVVDEAYTLKVPASLDPAAAAPLLCAGITTYSPLKHWKAGPGKKIGIVGLGGLGHMGLKFSHAFGAQTVMFTTSANKIEDAKKLGADEVILTKEAGWHEAHLGTFDFILDCVSAPHDVNPYLNLLKRDGVMCSVGVPETPISINTWSVISRRSYTGSAIGGIAETQEMLDFCAEHGIVSDIEMTSFKELETAWDRVVKADVKYRFVLDLKTL
ncbi:NAD(P)-dependent alcohol dehydrogenase [Granulicella tundricola]|uniref:Alcohol dehydrogenase GroES domain protein n=1 Tax=Granulicella tundricola (strain ATCC BAA-1859 / DSM 23138 / MP5ACTX9) TaxID=1198114 RepID=E8X5L9_GRATM|nr:NAD(P)-dependent alcohol dehydrogenase [Granulicella tundricola]ADW70646.1 Alcohol dehydrogenase GroES domain protein [Granulicella tundricola MP5ACTX9]